MTFLLRSVFWLGLAFVFVAPRPDAGDAQSLARAAAQIVETVSAECDASLPCRGGKAVMSMTLNSNPSTGSPMQDSPVNSSVPFPRPRPDRMG